MEDPRRDVAEVVRGLVGRPTFKQQADVVRHYYSPDARFHHYLVDIDRGIDDIIAVYQLAHAVFNYQAASIHKVLYDETTDHMAVQLTIYSRPWVSLGMEVSYDLLLQIFLEDWPQEDGKVLKRIRFQRSFFERDQFIQVIPVIGLIYSSDKLRFLLGRVEAVTYETLRNLFDFFLPSKVRHGLLGLWVHHEAARKQKSPYAAMTC